MKITFFAILVIASLSAKAQKADSVTTQELNRYAVMMDSLENLKAKRAELSTRFAKGNSTITPARYNQLLSIIDDQKKLTAAKATTDEIAYVKKALSTLTAEGQKFQTAFTSLVSEYVGYDTYNKVKSAIETNKRVKDRYYIEFNRLRGISTDVQ